MDKFDRWKLDTLTALLTSPFLRSTHGSQPLSIPIPSVRIPIAVHSQGLIAASFNSSYRNASATPPPRSINNPVGRTAIKTYTFPLTAFHSFRS